MNKKSLQIVFVFFGLAVVTAQDCCDSELQPFQCATTRNRNCFQVVPEPQAIAYAPCGRSSTETDCCDDESPTKTTTTKARCCDAPKFTFTLPEYVDPAGGSLWVLSESTAGGAWMVNGVEWLSSPTNSLDWFHLSGVSLGEDRTVVFEAKSAGSHVAAIYFGAADPDLQGLRRRSCYDIDYCGGGACINGGTCTSQRGAYSCSCVEGYDGSNCELDRDECLGDPCGAGGECTDLFNDYSCSCLPGFAGDHCEVACTLPGTCSSGVNTIMLGNYKGTTFFFDAATAYFLLQPLAETATADQLAFGDFIAAINSDGVILEAWVVDPTNADAALRDVSVVFTPADDVVVNEVTEDVVLMYQACSSNCATKSNSLSPHHQAWLNRLVNLNLVV